MSPDLVTCPAWKIKKTMTGYYPYQSENFSKKNYYLWYTDFVLDI